MLVIKFYTWSKALICYFPMKCIRFWVTSNSCQDDHYAGPIYSFCNRSWFQCTPIALGKRYFKTILSEWMLQRFLAAFIGYWNPCASHSNPFYIVHRTTSSIEFLTLLAYIWAFLVRYHAFRRYVEIQAENLFQSQHFSECCTNKFIELNEE